MAFATEPQVFLFLKKKKKVSHFIISILNREMLLIFGSLFLFIFLDTHFSVCLSRPERVQVFCNVSNKLPLTPSPLKAKVEAEQLCEGDSHTTPTQSQLHVIIQCKRHMAVFELIRMTVREQKVETRRKVPGTERGSESEGGVH